MARVGAKAGKLKLLAEQAIHIADSHLAGGVLSAGKSLFFNAGDIMPLLHKAEGVAPVLVKNGNYGYIVDAGREIGLDRETGLATTIYTVIATPDGTVITMHPGLPTR